MENYDTTWKVFSQGIHLCNMKVLSLLVWKLWLRLYFIIYSVLISIIYLSIYTYYTGPQCKLEYWQSQEGPRWALCKFAGAKLKFFKSRSKVTVKVTCSKFMVPMERPCHKEHICQICKPYLLAQTSYDQCQSCSKVGQRSWSRSHVWNLWYQRKGLVIRNTHAK